MNAQFIVETELAKDEHLRADLSDAATRRRLSPAAIEILANLATLWGLRHKDTCALLGGITESRWRYCREHRPDLTQDQLTRISILIGIHRGLRAQFGKSLGDAWPTIGNSNSLFAGRTPLDSMIHGGIPQMLAIRELVTGWTSGEFR